MASDSCLCKESKGWLHYCHFLSHSGCQTLAGMMTVNQTRVTKGVKAVIFNKEEWTLELHFAHAIHSVLLVDFVAWCLLPFFKLYVLWEFHLLLALSKPPKTAVNKPRAGQDMNRKIAVTVECIWRRQTQGHDAHSYCLESSLHTWGQWKCVLIFKTKNVDYTY